MFSHYWEIFKEGWIGYARYFWQELTQPGLFNYFYWLVGISLFFLVLEIIKPWKSDQKAFRKDFWLDGFYMFFNFFLFSLIIYNAASDVVVNFFQDTLASLGITNLAVVKMQQLNTWLVLLIGFLARDFIHWWVHRLLHSVPFLWEFHKVHHSVQEMGFASHLRFHWMETIVYRSLEYIPLALIGINLNEFFIIHITTLAIGHWNHTNFTMDIGPLKYIFNNPHMHRWHHAYHLPKERAKGVNFAISLSLWDYLFGTVYIPHDSKNIELGFPGVEKFPRTFLGQLLYGFKESREKNR
jgi:sterol desaturase/sphingolipid hydroxylase (fatty acid hydroxylase superfamily)